MDKFSKSDFLKSESYKDKKDLINTILDDNTEYTASEVDRLIKKYLSGRVI